MAENEQLTSVLENLRNAASALVSEGELRSLGEQLNFLHRVMATVLFAAVVHVFVSRSTEAGAEGPKFTFFELRGESPRRFKNLMFKLVTLALFWLGLGAAVSGGALESHLAAPIAAASVWWPFLPFLRGRSLRSDHWWSALLCSATLWILFWWF